MTTKFDIPEDVLDVFQKLNLQGHQAFMVGGWVRDSLLGRFAKDFDVATDARPEQVQTLFKGFAVPTGLKHGTVTVLTKEKTPVEVTTFRSDGLCSDGRHPDAVRFVQTIEEDLARRDFTMNAIAWDPLAQRFVDPFRGRFDLDRRLVRAVGDPKERFAEDGLRVMRAIRQACRLGFVIDPATFMAITGAHETFRKVSAERVRDELLKMLDSVKPSWGIRVMLATGLLNIVLPELVPGVGMHQNRFHAHDVFDHVMLALDGARGDAILKLAVLLHDVGKPTTRDVRTTNPLWAGECSFLRHEMVGAKMAREICGRLKLSNEQTERVVFIVEHHMELHQLSLECSNATLRRFANRIGAERLPDLFAMAKADMKGMSTDTQRADKTEALRARVDLALKEATAFRIKDLAVNGEDVMSVCNLQPGQAVGERLQKLFTRVIEQPELNTRETLLRLLKEEA